MHPRRPRPRARGRDSAAGGSPLHLDPHRRREPAPERHLTPSRADEDRTAEWLAAGHLDHVAEGDPLLGEIAQHRWIRVGYAHEPPDRAARQLVQACGLALVDFELGGGYGVAAGIDARVPEARSDPGLEVF